MLYACSLIEPRKLFNLRPMPLSQCVLLSLIQQLGCDLSKTVMQKLLYLNEALLVVQLSDEDVARHLPGILEAIRENLEQHVAALSNSNASPMAAKLHQQVVAMLTQRHRGPAPPALHEHQQ